MTKEYDRTYFIVVQVKATDEDDPMELLDRVHDFVRGQNADLGIQFVSASLEARYTVKHFD